MKSTDLQKLQPIEKLARRYGAARGKLSRAYARFERALQLLQDKHLPKIRAELDATANIKSELEVALLGARELFKEPRTLVLHGIRVGFMDGKPAVKLPRGKQKISAVLAAIREQFTAEQIATLGLIERVAADVPSQAALLKLLEQGKSPALPGVECTTGGERVFILPADHALDKVISKVLKEGLQKGAAAGGDMGEDEEAA